MLLSYGAFQVTQCGTGANMSVDIQPGRAAFQGNYVTNEGAYYLWSDALENVVIAAAPGIGQERYDVIVAQVRNGYVDGGVNNDFLFTKIQGTPAATGSAVVPGIGSNQLALATVHVASQVTTIVTGAITDTRPPLWCVVQPPPLASGAAFQSYTDSQGDVWVAKGGIFSGAWRRATSSLYARWQRNAALTSATVAPAYLTFDSVQFDSYSMWQAASPGFVVPIPGLYRVGLSMTFTTTAAGQQLNAAVYQTSFRKMQFTTYSGAAGPITCTTTGIIKCVAGDWMGASAISSVALAYVVNTAFNSWYEINYLGTG
jgi:hypothetical protein